MQDILKKIFLLLWVLLAANACNTPSPEGHKNKSNITPVSYYISPQGDDSADGLSEATAWQRFSQAIPRLQAGDTLYVKAGRYTDNPINLYGLGGTDKQPIHIIGYDQTPGDLDIPDTPGNRFDPHQLITPSLPDPQHFPTIDGEFKNIHYSGIAFNQTQYVTLKNLHVTGFQSNVSLYQSNHNLLDNLVVSHARGSLSYTGFGLKLTQSNHNTLQHIIAISNQGENISLLQSHYNLLNRCQSHGGLPGDDNGTDDGTDYYIVIAQSHHNTVRQCLAHRHSNIKHTGHGIGIKASGSDTYDNLILNSVTRNMGKGFYARHHQAFNNQFINCTAYGDSSLPGLVTRGFVVRDGAHDNRFTACKGVEMDYGIALYDTVEDGGFGQEQNNNHFAYCEFNRTRRSVLLFEHSASHNRFDSLMVDAAPQLLMLANNPAATWLNNTLHNPRLGNIEFMGTANNDSLQISNQKLCRPGLTVYIEGAASR